MASSGVEAFAGVKEATIKGALSAAMEAQSKRSQKKQYLKVSDKASNVFIAFPGSWIPVEWLAPVEQNEEESSFGEIETSQDVFLSLRSLRSSKGIAPAIVNKAFLKKFLSVWDGESLQDRVQKAMDKGKQIVFTGHSSGGAAAILATVKSLEKYLMGRETSETSARIRCITFGSPLVGDYIFAHALRRENWAQHFLHFVTLQDIVPRLMLAPRSSIEENLPRLLNLLKSTSSSSSFGTFEESSDIYRAVARHVASLASSEASRLMEDSNPNLDTLAKFVELSPYRPFGSFVFCTGNERFVGVNNPDAVLQLLYYPLQLTNQSEAQNVLREMVNAHKNYKKELNAASLDLHLLELDQIPLSSDDSERTESDRVLDDLNMQSTRARLCLRAAGKAERAKSDNLEEIEASKHNIETKLHVLGSYKSKCEKGIGYYDQFKSSLEEDDFRANVTRVELSAIWDQITGMLRKHELPDDFETKQTWIGLGTWYRCLVEPLEIANYYRHFKNKDTGPYMIRGRPRRYIFTQQWLEYNELKSKGINEETYFLNEVSTCFLNEVSTCSLNEVCNLRLEDIHEKLKGIGSKTKSCFWAEVEELKGLYEKKPFDDIKLRVLVLERMLDKWINEKKSMLEKLKNEKDNMPKKLENEKESMLEKWINWKEIGNEPLLQGSTFVQWWHTLPEQHKQSSVLRERPELFGSGTSN